MKNWVKAFGLAVGVIGGLCGLVAGSWWLATTNLVAFCLGLVVGVVIFLVGMATIFFHDVLG